MKLRTGKVQGKDSKGLVRLRFAQGALLMGNLLQGFILAPCPPFTFFGDKRWWCRCV